MPLSRRPVDSLMPSARPLWTPDLTLVIDRYRTAGSHRLLGSGELCSCRHPHAVSSRTEKTGVHTTADSEAVLVGFAAALYSTVSADELATVEDTERFLVAYRHARGREFSADELERSWAAGVWTR